MNTICILNWKTSLVEDSWKTTLIYWSNQKTTKWKAINILTCCSLPGLGTALPQLYVLFYFFMCHNGTFMSTLDIFITYKWYHRIFCDIEIQVRCWYHRIRSPQFVCYSAHISMKRIFPYHPLPISNHPHHPQSIWYHLKHITILHHIIPSHSNPNKTISYHPYQSQTIHTILNPSDTISSIPPQTILYYLTTTQPNHLIITHYMSHT